MHPTTHPITHSSFTLVWSWRENAQSNWAMRLSPDGQIGLMSERMDRTAKLLEAKWKTIFDVLFVNRYIRWWMFCENNKNEWMVRQTDGRTDHQSADQMNAFCHCWWFGEWSGQNKATMTRVELIIKLPFPHTSIHP